MTQLLTCFRRALHTVGALLWVEVGGQGTRQQIHGMGASCAAGARKMLFFLQRDSHSAGCTRQTPPNRVSADSPSRILPGDVLVSLRFPPPKKLHRCEWRSGNSHSSEVFCGHRKRCWRRRRAKRGAFL